ncbi:hypothetical protein [Bacillus toyonensis]|uniref:hypothetical protein n=1 Tax=Bacillus toyonensis TaxID=155322 RepID=UPI000BF77C51|nr:hypothetical protein [Bacillus toyonensis]PGE58426.1 hypothetical protein COM69_29515 [Bacillus toyonensis]PHD42577.1 hypothetical protein COF65_12420 [Bacillus toyonensis]
MFLQKYKGLIIGIIGAVIGILSFFYLKDLDYMYRLGLRLFSITLITIGWIIAENSNHFYKKKDNGNV